MHGLLRFAGLTEQGVLIGLADGAVWIADLFVDLGVHRHVLDVFHASQYLETVMIALAWSDKNDSSIVEHGCVVKCTGWLG